jgi:Cys-tRNA(Pro) deacylase
MTAASLSTFLRDNGVRGEVLMLAQHTHTVEAAAEALGVSTESIVKTVVFRVDVEPVLVIALGTSRIDIQRLADYLGVAKRKVRLADPQTVLERTGYAVGAVPPVGHPAPVRTLVDERVLGLAEVYAGGGAVDAMLRIAPAEIVRVTRAETVRLGDG